MTRFGNDPERFFAAVYEGSAPWDVGGPQPALVELFRDYPLQDPFWISVRVQAISLSGSRPGVTGRWASS